MSTPARVLIAIILIVTLGGAATVAMAAAAIYRTGTIAVNVQQTRGAEIDIAIPAGLVELALSLVPDGALEIALDEAHAELELIEPWLPAVGAAWRELARAPDFVLLEVVSASEQVRIEKKNRVLVVSVIDPGNTVHVEIPLRTINKVLRKLGT